MSAVPPAFVLALACCRWPPSENRKAVIGAAVSEIADWSDFLRQVDRQRIAGLAYDALSSADVALPPAIGQGLGAKAQQIAHRNLSFAAETVRLQRAFKNANIPSLVLKGVALAQLGYGSLTIKHARDIDLLVSPDRAEAAMQILERDGYRLALPAEDLNAKQRRALVAYGREAEFVLDSRGFRLELQWRAADNPHLLKDVDAHSGSQSVYLADDISVQTLRHDDLFAYLCFHGARHAWSRLKWLADVNAMLVRPDTDIPGLYRHAQGLGAGLCAGQALLLCHRLLDLQLSPALLDELQANRRIEKIASIAMGVMTAPHTETEVDGGPIGVARSVLRQFLLGEGRGYFVAQCKAIAVGLDDVIYLPLPRRLHFLYPLLRVPLWLWRRLLVALRNRKLRLGLHP
jgi:Uncharacterised nucleotidyltransferase